MSVPATVENTDLFWIHSPHLSNPGVDSAMDTSCVQTHRANGFSDYGQSLLQSVDEAVEGVSTLDD